MKKLIIALVCIVSFIGCKKEEIFDGPNFYEDGFENYSSVEELILPYPDLDKFWSFNQITKTENFVMLDTTKSHSGTNSIKFFAKKTDAVSASKASISKQHMAFWEGETVRFEGWYFIEGTTNLDWLFLCDIEEQTAIGAGPGMRLTLVDNQLRVEYKFNEKDIVQDLGQPIDFPRDQWVEIVWELKLSRKTEGEVRVWQDGQLIIDGKNKTTLPKDLLYFQQGTKGMYSQIEVGITANSPDNEVMLWVDDVKIEKEN